jgi:hypothetical protein
MSTLKRCIFGLGASSTFCTASIAKSFWVFFVLGLPACSAIYKNSFNSCAIARISAAASPAISASNTVVPVDAVFG